MRKTSVWVLCGLMGLATAAMAAAQTGSTGAMGTESGTGSMSSGSTGSMSSSGTMSKSTHKAKSSKKHTTAKSSSMTGDVTEAADGGNFTVKNKKAEKQFNCSDSTKFTAKGKTCKDIAKDQNVTVWYDSKLTVVPTPATKIRWNKAMAAAAPAAAPAPATTP